MGGTGQNLTAKQEKALASLLASGEVKAAAKDSGVGETTLWRWLKDEAFKAAYRAARREVVEVAISRLQSDATAACRVLLEVAEDTSAPASARVSAAKAIIEQALGGVTLADLQSEVEEIKRLLAEAEGGSGANRR